MTENRFLVSGVGVQVSGQRLARKVYPPQEGGQSDRERNFVILLQLFLDYGSGF